MLDDNRFSMFARLFRGRDDVFGTEEGGCDRILPSQTQGAYTARLQRHLDGSKPMGVYPMVPDRNLGWVVNWGCVDFDEGEEVSFIHALNLRTVLEAFDITAFIERSRSKGYHVWVFASEPVKPTVMRHALLAATQMAKAPTREINPKSEILDVDQIGNYVRLPYVGGWESTHRRCMVDEDGYPIGVETFVDIAYPERVTSDQLVPLMDFYEPPKQIEFVSNGATADPATELPPTTHMNPTAYMTWRDGPFESKDRSGTLWKLARELKASGYGPNETMLLVMDADRRWGKHIERNDIAGLERLVTKVYAR